MTGQQEMEMLLELLNTIEQALGISFSPEEHKRLQNYLSNNPNADPEKIMAEIIAIIERKLLTKLGIEKTKKLKDRCRQSKLLIAREKVSPTLRKIVTPTEKVILLIRAAEKRLFGLKKIKRELTDQERQKAVDFYNNHVKPEDAPIAKANFALLGVVNTGIAGGIRPIVLQSWGNLLNAPGYNPYHGESAGGAAIDQAERINLSRGNFDLEQRAIINAIQNYSINQPFLEKLMNVQMPQSPDAVSLPRETGTATDNVNHSTPIPVPTPSGNPYDPFQ